MSWWPLLVFCALGLFAVLLFLRSAGSGREPRQGSDDDSERNSKRKAKKRRPKGDGAESQAAVEVPKALELQSGRPTTATRKKKKVHSLHRVSLKGHKDEVTCVDFSANGCFVVTGSADRSLRIWDVSSFDSGKPKFVRISTDDDFAVQCAFGDLQRSQQVVVSTERGSIRIYEFEVDSSNALVKASRGMELQPLLAIAIAHDVSIVAVAMCSASDFIVSVGSDTEIKIWSASSGGLLKTINTNMIYNTCAALSRDGRLLAIGGFLSDVKVWEIGVSKSKVFEKAIVVLNLAHKNPVTWISFARGCSPELPSDDGPLEVATTSNDGFLRFWDLNVRYHLKEDARLVSELPHACTSLRLSATHIASVDTGVAARVVTIIERASGRAVEQIDIDDGVGDFAWSQDAKSLGVCAGRVAQIFRAP